jgi:hypothetical protein
MKRISMKIALGNSYRVVLPIFVNGAPVAGQVPIISIQLASDGTIWDFTNLIFTDSPTLAIEDMTEDAVLSGYYYYEFDSSILSEADIVRFLCRNVDGTYGKDLTVEVEFNLDETVSIQSAAVYDFATGFFYASALGIQNHILIADPSQCTFTVYHQDGSIVLDPVLDTGDVNGIFQIISSDFTPVANTSYFLQVEYEFGGNTYVKSLPFNVL